MAFDYPNGTWTVATIPVLAIMLMIGWRGLKKQREAVKLANQQESSLR
jgi:L-asparagine permease